VIVNQGEMEHQAQTGLLRSAGIQPLIAFRHDSPFFRYELPAVLAALRDGEAFKGCVGRSAAAPASIREPLRRSARSGLPSASPHLILCAHVDSARAIAFRAGSGAGCTAGPWTSRSAAIAIAPLALLDLFGFPIPAGLALLAGILASLAGGWTAWADLRNQPRPRGSYSPGANDNASGLGVLLALDERHGSSTPAGAAGLPVHRG
jgi:hypothetical protein